MMADEIVARSLRGTMPVRFRYTPGAAGLRFFETLRAKGLLAATRCPTDGITYLPPRLYCEECFADLSGTWLELPARGHVHAFTVVHVDRQGRALARPEIAAFVRIAGTDGGLVTRLLNVEPAAVRTGLEVEAVLRPV
ncbi:MAG TPA: Zn-ribbon domain-containing OB-fold protein, partial [bacterium]|nr:Zn-ribbon domain-containing OB-fold protein [bacterium]